MKRVRRLPVVPLAVPVQLVLGLDLIGIRKPKRRRMAEWQRPAPVSGERAA